MQRPLSPVPDNPPQIFPAAMCRYCCKSPKLPAANFSAVKKSDRRPPVDVTSITFPRSPASFPSGDEVPHIFTRKSRVQPKEILIRSAKKVLQTNRHWAAERGCPRSRRVSEGKRTSHGHWN